jgi:hypothetical protein
MLVNQSQVETVRAHFDAQADKYNLLKNMLHSRATIENNYAKSLRSLSDDISRHFSSTSPFSH